MWALVQNNAIVRLYRPDEPFTYNNRVSPIMMMSAATRTAAGLYPVRYAEKPDERYYFNVEDTPIFDTEAKEVVYNYVSTIRPIEQLRAVWKAAIDAKRDSLLTGGYAKDFTGYMAEFEDDTTADAGPQVLQTRGLDDSRNWQTLDSICSKAILAGAGATQTKVRCASNANVIMTVSQCSALLTDMAIWGQSVLDKSWALKNLVSQAADKAALDAIDIEAGFAQ